MNVIWSTITLKVSASLVFKFLRKKVTITEQCFQESRKSGKHANNFLLTRTKKCFLEFVLLMSKKYSTSGNYFYSIIFKPCNFNVNLCTFVFCVGQKVPKHFSKSHFFLSKPFILVNLTQKLVRSPGTWHLGIYSDQ